MYVFLCGVEGHTLISANCMWSDHNINYLQSNGTLALQKRTVKDEVLKNEVQINDIAMCAWLLICQN